MMTYGELDNTLHIYESNVKDVKNRKYTTGGRVLSVVSVDNSISEALQNIYNNIHKISYSGAYYRRDIGCNNPLTRLTGEISIGVLASGNGTCLEYLLEQKPNSVKIIISNKADASIIRKAHYYKIAFLYIPTNNQTSAQYYEKIVNILRLYNIELVILAGYMKVVTEILYDEFHTINIHPSLLPNYSGLIDMNIHEAVINNSDLFSGCTLHKVIKSC